MVISSIDMKGGRVVQLKNGKETVLERNDAEALITEFNKYGETAIIDLDAAMGKFICDGSNKGKTENTDIIRSLLRKGSIRVGGGIREVKKAKELISLGAEKVIIGSAAFNSAAKSDDNILNTAFLDELTRAIGKQRLIIAVDSLRGLIAVKGWTESAGIPLIEGAQAAEKYASELLFTCVEREGCMSGADMVQTAALRKAVQCRLVAAGGVSSLDEIIALQKLDVDVQLGMALYTGKVSLQEGFIECLNWEKAAENSKGLIPLIAQSVNGEVLMIGFANREALNATFNTGKLSFWSRSRNSLWTKGETSGNVLSLVKLRADCDRDSLLATVKPCGPVCHLGGWSCFSSEAAEASSMERLQAIIAERFAKPSPGSYTASLDAKRVREKIAEESEELITASGKDEVIWETADLLYFVSVLMQKENVSWQDIYNELDRRHKK